MSKDRSAEQENELLRLVARGDREAFRELYNLTERRIYFYLYRILQEESLAEDVQMEVFTQVWKGAGNFKGKSKATTWMFGIARNLAMNELRKKRNYANIDDYAHMPDQNQPDLDAPDRQRVLKKAMEMLSTKHKEVLDFVFYQQMNYQDIADIIDVSVNTVKTRVFYAKAAMREAMSKMGVTKNDI